MTTEEIDQVRAMIKEEISSHLHGQNAPKVPFSGIKLTAQTALTAADATSLTGTLNSGDATTDTVIGNIRTVLNNVRLRLNELEVKLRALGLIN